MYSDTIMVLRGCSMALWGIVFAQAMRRLLQADRPLPLMLPVGFIGLLNVCYNMRYFVGGNTEAILLGLTLFSNMLAVFVLYYVTDRG